MGNSTSTTDVVGIARYPPVDSGGFDDCASDSIGSRHGGGQPSRIEKTGTEN